MTGFFVFAFVFIIGYFIINRKDKNPYIRTHKAKWKNENDYKSYLDWLNKTKPDIPFPELKIDHEQKVINELNKTINK